jgi:hypothetical protein
VARELIVGPRFLASCSRCGIRPGSPQARWLKRALDELGAAETLPGASDYETGVPPVATSWVRAIPRASLWVYYSFRPDRVIVELVKDVAPEPLG